jgi:DNA polymerase-3 subunit delta
MKQIPVSAFDKYLTSPLKDNLFVIHGEERFFHDAILDKLDQTLFKNRAEKELNLHLFYGTDASVSDVLSACLSFPMLTDRKLVVVKEFDKLQVNDKESFLKYILNPQSKTILVLVAERFGTNKFQKDILKSAISILCRYLNNNDLYQWTLDKFNQADIKINKDSISFLVENIGSNLLRLNLEIEKIINFLNAGESLTLGKISQITGFTREVNIFSFQKYLAVKNLKACLKIGNYLLEQGESLAAILPMLFIYFRRMWVVKQLLYKSYSQSKILEIVGGSSYVYRDIFTTHANFTSQQLEFIFEKLQEAEVQYKTSQKSQESILIILSYFICNFKKN